MNTATLLSTRTRSRELDLVFPGEVAYQPKRGMELVDLQSLGILPMVAGGARGTNTEGDVLTQTVDGRDLNELWAEFQATVQAQNAERQRLIQFLTFPVTSPVEDVAQFVGDDFEEASEFGEPKGIRASGTYFSLGYDFKWYDLAARFTWKFLAEADARQVEAINNAALEADSRLVFQRVFKTIFDERNLQTDIRGQAYPVYKFYNGDGTVPPAYNGQNFDGAHTHYYTSGAATVDAGDVEEIIDHLKHHGYSTINGHRVVIMAHSAQAKIIRQFRFGTNGATFDFIPAQGQPGQLFVPGTVLMGSQPSPDLQGLNVIGSYGNALIVENDYIPAGYLFGFASGGAENLQNPVGFREHANAGLRGLRLVKGANADYPLVDSFYNRGFGTGIRHRGAGVVVQISAAAEYSTPAQYA